MGLTKELIAYLVCTKQGVTAMLFLFVALPLPGWAVIEERRFSETSIFLEYYVGLE